MNIIKKFSSFIQSRFKKDNDIPIEKLAQEDIEQAEEIIKRGEQGKVGLTKRNILTKLNFLEKTILVLKTNFPDAYNIFNSQIQTLKQDYEALIQDSKNEVTFIADPDVTFYKVTQIKMLEASIDEFIQKEYKFGIAKNRFIHLIVKINELYNVSLELKDEKERIIKQLRNGIAVRQNLIDEIMTYDFVLKDKDKSQELYELVTFSDYVIFKTYYNTTTKNDIELLSNTRFEKINVDEAFKGYILEELTHFSDIAKNITNAAMKNKIEREIEKLKTNIVYLEGSLTDTNIWEDVLKIENQVFKLLKAQGTSKDQLRVEVLDRYTTVEKIEEMYIYPKDYIELCLSEMSEDNLEKVLPMIKILENLESDVSYKELYFLLLIFDLLEDVLKSSTQEVKEGLEKYKKKYPYSKQDLYKKKKLVMNMDSKEYMPVFKVKQSEKAIVQKSLENANIDYKFSRNKVLFNTFYFNELKHVSSMLLENSKNI